MNRLFVDDFGLCNIRDSLLRSGDLVPKVENFSIRCYMAFCIENAPLGRVYVDKCVSLCTSVCV